MLRSKQISDKEIKLFFLCQFCDCDIDVRLLNSYNIDDSKIVICPNCSRQYYIVVSEDEDFWWLESIDFSLSDTNIKVWLINKFSAFDDNLPHAS